MKQKNKTLSYLAFESISFFEDALLSQGELEEVEGDECFANLIDFSVVWDEEWDEIMVSVVVCAIERGEAERVDTSCRDMIDFPLVCCECEVWDEVTARIVLSLFFDRTPPVGFFSF